MGLLESEREEGGMGLLKSEQEEGGMGLLVDQEEAVYRKRLCTERGCVQVIAQFCSRHSKAKQRDAQLSAVQKSPQQH